MTRSPAAAAIATFSAFLLCGMPLLPFALRLPHALTLSVVLTAIALFAVGSARSRWLLLSW